jgi:DNA anti-recombination protein RmuC
MAFENFPEVWAALGRLYDSITEMQKRQAKTDEQLAQLVAVASEHERRFDAMTERFNAMSNATTERFDAMTERFDAMTERLDRTVATVATLAGVVTKLTGITEQYGGRLDRLEGQ